METDSSHISKNAFLKCPTKGSKAIYEKQLNKKQLLEGKTQRNVCFALKRKGKIIKKITS